MCHSNRRVCTALQDVLPGAAGAVRGAQREPHAPGVGPAVGRGGAAPRVRRLRAVRLRFAEECWRLKHTLPRGHGTSACTQGRRCSRADTAAAVVTGQAFANTTSHAESGGSLNIGTTTLRCSLSSSWAASRRGCCRARSCPTPHTRCRCVPALVRVETGHLGVVNFAAVNELCSIQRGSQKPGLSVPQLACSQRRGSMVHRTLLDGGAWCRRRP